MTELGVDERALLEAGLLVKRDDGAVIPRFRGRLLFPIHDLRGRVVAFGGRILRSGEPKYLNSPETPIFHKGANLYNLHQAKNAIRKEGMAILVEGYFDALRLVSAGVESVVAPLGTALTTDQAALIKRFAPAVTLLYDSDQAGLRATFRAGDEGLRQGLRVLVATMPAGEDPDTLVRAGGAAALEPILRDAIDVVERKLQLLERKGWFAGVERRREALDRLLPTLRATIDPIARDLYLGLVGEKVGVTRAVLEHELENKPRAPAIAAAAQSSAAAPIDRVPVRPKRRRPEAKVEAQLLRLLLEAPDWLARARREVPPERFQVPAYREIFQRVCAEPDVPVDAVYDRLGPEFQDVWQRLMRADVLTPDLTRADDTYAAAIELMEEGELLRAAPPIEDVEARRAWFAQLKPETRRRYQLRKAASRARTRYPDARSEG
jgi:DNA primase